MKRFAWFAVTAILSISAPAFADDSPEEQARAAMERGVGAFGRGESEVALKEYETAKRLAPKANAPYLYAAEALTALGRYPEAVANLERYLAIRPDVSDADQVKRRIARMKAEHYPGHVHVVADAAAFTVSVDAAAGDRGASFDVMAGHHRLEIRAPDREPVVREIDVVGEQTLEIEVALPPHVDAPTPPATVTPPTTVTSATPWPTVGWATAGAGAALVIVGVVLDAGVLGPKIDDYRAAAARSDASARDLRESAVTLRSWTIASYAVGGALLGGGVGILLFAPRTHTTVAPWVGPGEAGVGIRGRM